MNAMTDRVNCELDEQNRRTQYKGFSFVLMAVAVIVLGHNTIVTLHPAIIHVPFINLFFGTVIMLAGIVLYRRVR